MTTSDRDFALLLDELLASATIVDDQPLSATKVSVDYLAVADELNHISITPDEAVAEYHSLDEQTPPIEPKLEEIVTVGDLPSIEPEEIARELCIARVRVPHELDRIRRDFAFINHPDRVETWARSRAEIRMQIANQLIDDAKKRLAGSLV
ncbi:hypothetical protein [Tianweitania sediminis]|jgi:hypothetical protein|nr:hypothetical protein [Tianweitania sediminis]HEV7415108.1 hypothetical protein [Tianweitania sediminis]